MCIRNTLLEALLEALLESLLETTYWKLLSTESHTLVIKLISEASIRVYRNDFECFERESRIPRRSGFLALHRATPAKT